MASPLVFALVDSGVQPGTYGDSQTVPQITVDRSGIVTGVQPVSIVGVPRTVATGTTTTIADGVSLVVGPYYRVKGTGQLIIKGDGALYVL